MRQLIRYEPLETTFLDYHGLALTVPAVGEIFRIKGVLILKRNAVRDYLDFVVLADHMGDALVAQALQSFDRLYRSLLCNNCKHSLPVPFLTIWRNLNCLNTRTLRQSGMTGVR